MRHRLRDHLTENVPKLHVLLSDRSPLTERGIVVCGDWGERDMNEWAFWSGHVCMCHSAKVS